MADKSHPYDLLVVGEINPDLILSGDVVPAFGQVEKLVETAALMMGSSAVIFACGAARLGLKVALIGKVGQDVFGSFMLAAMQARQVDTHAVRIDPQIGTGFSVILNRGVDRAILTYPGAIPTLRLADIDETVIAQARHLHLTSYFLQTGLRPDVPALFDLAHRHGLTTSLDTNYDPTGCWEGADKDHPMEDVLRRTDIFLPNETECCAIAHTTDLDLALEALSRQIGMIAVKQGRRGASLRLQDRQTLTAEAVPVEVIDTVGAGDSFDAGFIYGFLKSWPLEQALRLATICGSLSTRTAGGTAGQVTLDEAQPYLFSKLSGDPDTP